MKNVNKFMILWFLIFILAIIILIWYRNYDLKLFQTRPNIKPVVRKPKITDNVRRIIHQSWKNRDIPDIFRNYSKSWTDYCFKNWTYMFWTDEDNLNFIKNNYPWFLNRYNSLPSHIYRADVMRFFYLFHYGGIYTDMDNECLKSFDHLLMNHSIVFGAMKGQFGGTTLKEGYVQNSFMYSRPKHEFWLEIIIEILVADKKHEPPEIMTGPVLLSMYIQKYINRMKNNDIIVYMPNYFNPFSWLHGDDPNCKTHNRMTNQEYQKCRLSMVKRGSYVVQYHAHTWG